MKDNKKIKSKGWFLVDKSNKQQFMIPSNRLVRVFCRSVMNQKGLSNYSMSVHENGQWIGNYMFDKLITENQAKITTNYKEVKNLSLSKTRSFYLNTPTSDDVDYSYYTFSIPGQSDENEKILIKIIEYEKSEK